MSTVEALGYVRLNAPDIGGWRAYATDILGLQVAEDVSAAIGDGSLYLKQDDRSYRLAIDPGEPGVPTFGWEVAHRTALDELAARLDAAGVAVEEASDEHAQSRQTIAMIRCDDPAGNKCEFFYGAKCDKSTFVSPTGARFTTGDMGVGHAFVMVPDGRAFEQFYSMLGFKVSDYIGFGPGAAATFMHCNARHHTMAFVEVPNVSSLVHIMLEVSDIDTVGRSWDRCLADDVPIVMTLGRHTNDRMFSFYSASPSGAVVEYGTGGIRVDDTWTVEHFDAISYWGHEMKAPPGPPPGATP